MTTIRKSPKHNGRYHRTDRKQVLDELYKNSELTMTMVAQHHHINPSTVHHWVHRFLPKEIAQSIVQRGHSLRGKQISKTAQFRARKQQERIAQFQASKQTNPSNIKQTLLSMKAQIEEMLKHV